MSIVEKLKTHIIEKTKETYGDDIVAIYGIGSAFQDSELFHSNDIDAVIILKSVEKCPRKEFTTALFENELFECQNIFFGYSLYTNLFEKELYEQNSFADWAWAIRNLKYGSVFIYGKDIRDELPVPDYDYQSIFLRVAYWLDRTIKYGNENPIALSKAIFKYGFFLTAIKYPEKNCFDKKGICDLLVTMESKAECRSESVIFYRKALEFRHKGTPFPNFKNYRVQFCKIFIKETISNVEGATWDSLKQILATGFGKGMPNVISIIERNGYS